MRPDRGESPELGAGSFFAWLGQIALSALCIIGVAVAASGRRRPHRYVRWFGSFHAMRADKLMALVASVATMLALVYGGGKFILAGPPRAGVGIFGLSK